MKVTIVGARCVGRGSAAGLPEMGNNVICAESDAGKVRILQLCLVPVQEPGFGAAAFTHHTSPGEAS